MQFVFTDTGVATGTLEETYATSWGRGLWSASFTPQPLLRVGIPDRPVILGQDGIRAKITCPKTGRKCIGFVIFRRIDPLPPKPPVHELVLARGRFQILPWALAVRDATRHAIRSAPTPAHPHG